MAQGRKRRVLSDAEKREICARARVPGIQWAELLGYTTPTPNRRSLGWEGSAVRARQGGQATGNFLQVKLVAECGCLSPQY